MIETFFNISHVYKYYEVENLHIWLKKEHSNLQSQIL